MSYFSRHESIFSNRDYLLSVLVGALFFSVSLVINYFASVYATYRASSPVTDLLLNNLPVVNVAALFIYGTLLLFGFIVFVGLYRPHRIPFILKSIALFVVIRSVFVTFTHLGPFPGQLFPPDTPIRWFAFTGDLFFSGHTGLPFLMALFFWENKTLRSVFLGVSFLFGAIVLLGRYHYSIDVFAAFFIAYGIADLAKLFFKKDYALFKRSMYKGLE